jgi:membrane-bound metal-dependent hydrolase YbcI (DUF457 family)
MFGTYVTAFFYFFFFLLSFSFFPYDRYLKAVSLTYATVYWSYILASVVTAAGTSAFLRYPITRFICALYLCVTCTYLASPKVGLRECSLLY